MDENTMPAVEASSDELVERDQYECAFHLLPTIADEEVARVVGEIKGLITSHGGDVFDEEEPQRFTLAYEMTKAIDGRSLHFTNSWLGWIRFSLTREMLLAFEEELAHRTDMIRHMTIRLTKEELLNPQRMFEKRVEPATVIPSESDADASGEVSEEDLSKSLEGITS